MNEKNRESSRKKKGGRTGEAGFYRAFAPEPRFTPIMPIALIGQ